MKKLSFLIFFFVLLSTLAFKADDHDIHLSLCELRYNESTSAFEVSIKIFIDDLEKAIAQNGVTELKIGTPGEDASSDEHIAAYLDQHFLIEVDGKRLKGEFIGKEMTDDLLAVWCFIEFPSAAGSKKCTLSNDVLFEIYDDQRNIMDIRMSRSHKDFTIFERGRNSWSYLYH